MRTNLVIGLFTLLPSLLVASDLPRAVIPEGVGVNIHFVAGHGKDLDLIAAAGFKWIRMDFTWEQIEKKKGEYDYSEYDKLLADLDQRSLRPLFILDYSNSLYEQDRNSPQHPESVAAFARWAAASARHYRGRKVLWEIWNEPNGGFWAPKADAAQYTTLALATGKEIRAADPGALVAGPASSGFPWPFLETFLASGVLQYLDAVTVHPYRESKKPPETAAADYEKLRKLIERYAPPAKKNLPIFSGEWGYSSHTHGVSPATQAVFAARQQLANLLANVPLSIWYDWKNDGPDPNENEHNFGTVQGDLTPKPAYEAIKTLTHELNGMRLERRITTTNAADYMLSFVDGKRQHALAVWTTGQPHTISVTIAGKAAGKLRGRAGLGEAFEPRMTGNKLEIELSEMPKYLHLGSATASSVQ